MRNKAKLSLLMLATGILLAGLFTGCGGGSSDSSDPATFVATLCAGTMTYQDSGMQNILFASVKGGGSGVAAWVEDQNGKKIANLSYVSAANSLEVTLSAAKTALTPGKYTLHYTVNTETFSLSRNLDWGAALPRFDTAPAPPTLNGHTISVGPVSVNPGIASYYLRLYSGISSDHLYSESTPTPGGVLSEYIYGSNDLYRVMVVADISAGGQIVATARYLFTADTYN